MKLTETLAKQFSNVLSEADLKAVEEFELDIATRGLRIGFAVVMGSRAFGVHREDSDVDIRGFYCYSPEYWQGSLHQAAPETLRLCPAGGKIDIELQELSTFIRLLGRQNQNNIMAVSRATHVADYDLEEISDYRIAYEVYGHALRVVGNTANVNSIEGQMRSDVFDLLRQDRSPQNIDKTVKNLIKLSYLRQTYLDDFWTIMFDDSELKDYQDALKNHHKSMVEKIMSIRQTTLITNSKDEDQTSKASEALKGFWPEGLLGGDADILSRIAAGTRNFYSESGNGKLETNGVAEMKMNTEIRRLVWQ